MKLRMYVYLKNHCFPLSSTYFAQKINSPITRADLAQAESQIMFSPLAPPGLSPLLLLEGVTSGGAGNALCSLLTANKRYCTRSA